jgi:hypothetical protein
MGILIKYFRLPPFKQRQRFWDGFWFPRCKTILRNSAVLICSYSWIDYIHPRLSTTRPFTWCQTQEILAHNVFFFFLVARFGILWGIFFGPVCAPQGKFCANEFSKRAYKFFKLRRHKRILACTNGHYGANLHGVNAQLCAQSCPSNQNTGHEDHTLTLDCFFLVLNLIGGSGFMTLCEGIITWNSLPWPTTLPHRRKGGRCPVGQVAGEQEAGKAGEPVDNQRDAGTTMMTAFIATRRRWTLLLLVAGPSSSLAPIG